MRQGIALVISAPSGAGKSTLCNRLLGLCPNLSYSVSCTTRPMRTGETDGKDYHFIDRSEFEKRRLNGDFAEWAEVHGNYYGTPCAPVQAALKAGRDILFDIDVQGAAQLRSSLCHAFLVFIVPPSMAVLKRRLDFRHTDSPDTINTRMANARKELASALWYDFLIVNDALDVALSELFAIYQAATHSANINASLIARLQAEA